MQKVLVTGAAGFIGYFTVKKLMEVGYEVVGLDNINDYYDINLKYARLKDVGFRREDAEVWTKETQSTTYKNLSFIRLNLEDRENLPTLFEKHQFDAVIHLAAQAGVRYSLENPMAYVDSNLVGYVNLLECCRHAKVKHLVYASSSSVYGENPKTPFEEEDRVDYPVSLYAATKKANELLAHTYSHLYQLPTTGLRFFTVYGPYGRPDMAPMLFATAITENRPIKVFNNGDMSRDFTFIDDIVNGIIISLKNPPAKDQEHPYYQLFNIGNGSPVSLMQFIETLEKELGKVADKNMMPMQAGDVPRTWAETTKLNQLGYDSTISIAEGVKEFVKWFKAYNKLS
ncbi:NAD-dependent epimerase [Weeksella virosa]|uniref:UDP-glucuronate 5'-epimerase n=1 Tax=Weeksella virosa (strain ATCC 43766 / DSM 16922 / JCM 21250 / CCUG 30538 / CDC 9751 / IAM 14551 / NBRC 16016 / NCTC 11634 / CL345/78) TaxID=865938 RepID=F0P1P2_WEEVC|nr:NAD-dependent epimerase [Weeksella virosa]ADX67670.1 UDP-glucuronate 5'-epimerase [Weeksella virosa DSM 16922]MDK7674216.1 NAD-dependent epimerase [Weeksella virosa]SUP53968.1 UDP-glucose 4-epimerase [Weeksella virosa]VEH64705.1 UDP-glucose 4-epimerase [Weeksella virosa]